MNISRRQLISGGASAVLLAGLPFRVRGESLTRVTIQTLKRFKHPLSHPVIHPWQHEAARLLQREEFRHLGAIALKRDAYYDLAADRRVVRRYVAQTSRRDRTEAAADLSALIERAHAVVGRVATPWEFAYDRLVVLTDTQSKVTSTRIRAHAHASGWADSIFDLDPTFFAGEDFTTGRSMNEAEIEAVVTLAMASASFAEGAALLGIAVPALASAAAEAAELGSIVGVVAASGLAGVVVATRLALAALTIGVMVIGAKINNFGRVDIAVVTFSTAAIAAVNQAITPQVCGSCLGLPEPLNTVVPELSLELGVVPTAEPDAAVDDGDEGEGDGDGDGGW